MYQLYFNFTGRTLPATVTSKEVVDMPDRTQGESVGFDCGGDIALILDADGETLATYTYTERV